jgi:hypothetical protein
MKLLQARIYGGKRGVVTALAGGFDIRIAMPAAGSERMSNPSSSTKAPVS